MTMTTGAYGNTSGTDERESRPLMAPLMLFSLSDEIESLRAEWQWADNDKNARTLAKDVDFRVLLSLLHTGATLDEEDGDARASFHVVEGSGEISVDGQTRELSAGQMAVVDAGRAWVFRATSDCAVLLTLAWPLEKTGV